MKNVKLRQGVGVPRDERACSEENVGEHRHSRCKATSTLRAEVEYPRKEPHPGLRLRPSWGGWNHDSLDGREVVVVLHWQNFWKYTLWVTGVILSNLLESLFRDNEESVQRDTSLTTHCCEPTWKEESRPLTSNRLTGTCWVSILEPGTQTLASWNVSSVSFPDKP